MNGHGTSNESERRSVPATWKLGTPGVLLVLTGPSGEVGRWRELIGNLAAVLGLGSDFEGVPGDRGEQRWVDAVVRRAAEVPGPVLVLPHLNEPPEVENELERRLERVLAPFDASDEVSASIMPVLQLLQETGVDVAQLHVTSPESVPGMWEGIGHHARAWHTELRRRHQVGPATVEVTGGYPAAAVATRARDADLVLMCWTRTTRAERAQVVRAVLQVVDIPVLLIARS